VLPLLVLLASIMRPGQLSAQEQECRWCVPCPYDENLMTLMDSHITMFLVLDFAILGGCEDYPCHDLLPCEPEEEIPDDVLEEVVTLVENGTAWEILAYAARFPDRIEPVRERGVLIVRHGCRGSTVTVLALNDES
jgi:hypothetical protein